VDHVAGGHAAAARDHRFSGGQGEADLLARCYRTSLALAHVHAVRTIAFPAISCGAYGFPVDQASVVAVRTVADTLRAGSPLRLVRFVLFSDADLEAYRRALDAVPD